MKSELSKPAAAAIIAAVAVLVLGGAYLLSGGIGGKAPASETLKPQEAADRYRQMGVPAGPSGQTGGGPPPGGPTGAEFQARQRGATGR